VEETTGPPLAAPESKPMRVIECVALLCRNRPFVILAFAIGFSNGVYGGLCVLLAQILAPFGISNNTAGWIGFTGSAASIFGSVAIGWLIDRYRRYKLPLVALSFFVLVCIAAIMVAFANNSAPLANAYVWLILLQILQAMLLAVVFEYSVELTFPVPEAFSGTVLMVLPNLLNVLVSISGSTVLGNSGTATDALWALGICVGVALGSGIVCLLVEERLRRVTLEAPKT